MLYVNNLFDENAKLSFDRERGGRARLASTSASRGRSASPPGTSSGS